MPSAANTTESRGSAHATNRAGLMTRRMTVVEGIEASGRSVVLLQVHAFVQRRHFLFVAVEHQGRHARAEHAGADLSFASLAPARMVDTGIHIGVEAVFMRRRDIPR